MDHCPPVFYMPSGEKICNCTACGDCIKCLPGKKPQMNADERRWRAHLEWIEAWAKAQKEYIADAVPCNLMGLAACSSAWAQGTCQAARRGISCSRYHELVGARA